MKEIKQNHFKGIKNIKTYGEYIAQLLINLDYKGIERIISCFLEARSRDSTIFFAGNGGSAATASHFAHDLAKTGRNSGKSGFKTFSLTDSVPFITSLANDQGYDAIFTGQMADLFRKNDILVLISASGNSPNLIRAAEYAKELGGITIGLVGFNGGKLLKSCDYALHIKTNQGEYGPAEDMHMVLDHMITTYLSESIKLSK